MAIVVRRMNEVTLRRAPVSTGMGDRLWAGISSRYVYQPTRSTQPCIPPGSRKAVPALAGVKAGMSPLPGGR